MSKAKFFLLGTIVAGLLITPLTCRWDSSPPNDRDFYLAAPLGGKGGAKKENGLLLLAEACKDLEEPMKISDRIDQILTPSEKRKWDPMLVKKYLGSISEKEKRFRLWKSAIEAKEFYYPFQRLAPDSKLFLSIHTRNFARVYALSALQNFHKGNQEKAFEQALELLRCAHRVQLSGGPLILLMYGYALERIALETLQCMAEETTLGRDKLIPVLQRLASARDVYQKGLRWAIRAEYTMMANAIDDIASGKHSSFSPKVWKQQMARLGYFFQPNRTKGTVLKYYRGFFQEPSRPYREFAKNRKARQKVVVTLTSRDWGVLDMLRPNAIGRMILRIGISSLDGVQSMHYERDFALKATQILLALRAYYNAKHRLPLRLRELCPAYFPKIPLDCWDNRTPLSYSFKERKIFSKAAGYLQKRGQREESKLFEIWIRFGEGKKKS